MDSSETSHSSKVEVKSNEETWCLIRVGKESDWLHLPGNTEVTIGRGLNVTYQLVSASCPLMISRFHCLFRQRQDGEWTVTDKKSLNGVWVNGTRILAERPHHLFQGDSIKLGVPFNSGTTVEYEYTLGRQPFVDIKPHLAKGLNEGACAAYRSKKNKRKFDSDDLEPSTSSKSKLCRHSTSDKSLAQPCPIDEHLERPGPKPGDVAGPSVHADERHPSPGMPSVPSSNLSSQQRYSQNVLALRERMDDTERRVVALEGEQDDPHRGEQVRELQNQLEVLRGQVHKMETLERSISETERRLEVQKTQQQEELLKKLLEDALQEQRKVIAELALSRQGFEEVLLAKDKELEVTKEEKEKAKAQREEVVTQMTEVLENELQCIICSELFIESVTLNCAHSFCLHCIREWRKRKDECPICRQAILSQTRSLVLDNCIDRMVDNLSPDMKDRRRELIIERKAAKPEEVVVIHDEDTSSSSSSSSSWNSIVSHLSMDSMYESSFWSSSPSNTSQDVGSDGDIHEY
ncbi:E3 ubiquitin-protein ligase rnf8 isoform X1 [Osmerus mordax]|uniref:E3 ubiquitin-protein ligase rnf8 isoform X1 n=1 Tax=Osmerus mordax TaxID=8014 RepID=UPI00350F6779